MNTLNLQPEILENDLIKLIPLQENHFDELYKVALDPLIWEQHPVKDRCKKEVFKPFFDAAIASKGAFLIWNKNTHEVMGTTRFYDYNPEKLTIAIGYTFIDRKFWGGNFNKSAKDLLIDYAFESVNSIFFHVGAENIRSQKAVLKLGATKIGEMNMPNNGNDVPHYEYELKK